MRAQREIDREAWAAEVELHIVRETGGNKAKFARLVGVDPKTVGRWCRREVNVSEESVRDVARRLGLNPMKMLVRLGYYTTEEAGTQSAQDTSVDDDDIEIRTILESNAPGRLKRELVKHVIRRREQDQERRMEDIRLMLRGGGEPPA